LGICWLASDVLGRWNAKRLLLPDKKIGWRPIIGVVGSGGVCAYLGLMGDYSVVGVIICFPLIFVSIIYFVMLVYAIMHLGNESKIKV
jgi:hypothetical protein